jgi:methane monooxygenase PmoA-like
MQAMRSPRIVVMAVLISVQALLLSARQTPRIQITANESNRRVDVTIDGSPFTSYVYPTSLKKPVLNPIRSANGVVVTRGFPLDPRPRERVDHPHQVGLWFNHGDVNGLDFWNNSDAIPADRAASMGTIVHRAVIKAEGGSNRGDLIVESDWKRADGVVLLQERTHYVFRGDRSTRSIDRITALTARSEPVTFRDNKEGTIGMRVARELEQPADKPEVFTDAAGTPSTVPVLDNTGVTGLYTSSEGLKGDAVWGTRGRWTQLSGTLNKEQVTIGILDHPSNPGFPTYWHARGYGLFAANPLGRKVFDPKQPELTLKLEPGKSITFMHRILVLNGAGGADVMEREYKAFASAKIDSTH